MRARHAAVPAAWLAAFLLAACASTTNGSGQGAGRNAAGAPSSAAASPSGVAASPGASSTAQTHPVPAHPVRTVTVHAPGGASYVVQIWAERSVKNCAAHAYGAVVTFLRRHPCSELRQVLATTTVDGRAVGFAQRSVGFRGGQAGYRTAGRFRELVTRDGTGNLDDLMREGYRLPSGPTSVPFPNAFSALAQDTDVTVVEAWYLHGATPDNDPPLVRMAQDIFLQV